jgi:hypothetical protein
MMFPVVIVGVVSADVQSVNAVRSEIRIPGLRTSQPAIVGDWALVGWWSENAGGQALLQRVRGRWVVRSRGGGVMDEATLPRRGVPADTARALVARLHGMR